MGQQIIDTAIEGVKIIEQFRADDDRGSFIKTFHQTSFREAGIDFKLAESFYSTSKKNVIRGMHFHQPPFDHAKIVFCTQGAILDVALDLRTSSKTYGQTIALELSAENHKALYIPRGFAHGFLSLSEESTAFYFVDGEYVASADDGILFSSIQMNWPDVDYIVSSRDKAFIEFSHFNSPF